MSYSILLAILTIASLLIFILTLLILKRLRDTLDSNVTWIKTGVSDLWDITKRLERLADKDDQSG